MPSLKALLEAGHRVAAVYTQPDRPSGRGRKLTASAVKQAAIDWGLEVRQPEKLSGEEQLQLIQRDQADLLVVVAYGQILSAEILQAPRLGAVNVHASLLPRWRGAAPIQRAIQAGDKQTGITIMQMDEGLDTGPMLLQADCAISPTETGGALHDRLSILGAATLTRALQGWSAGVLKPEPQPEAGVTYAKKLSKAEANIDWFQDVASIDRMIRAFDPFPVAFTFLNGERIRIFAANQSAIPSDASPGTVVAVQGDGIGVATGTHLLWLRSLQPEGKRRMSVGDFLNARELQPGNSFSCQ